MLKLICGLGTFDYLYSEGSLKIHDSNKHSGHMIKEPN